MHLPIASPEGGLKRQSVILCDAVRSVSRERLETCWGRVTGTPLADVTDRLAALLDL